MLVSRKAFCGPNSSIGPQLQSMLISIHMCSYLSWLFIFMQYKPPKLKKKSSDQDATPSKKSVHPPGYHLVPRKSNFSGTYTLDDENSPERHRSYQSPYGGAGGRNGGGHVVRAQVPKSFSQRMTTSSHTSATPARDLPGIYSMSRKLY